MRPIVLLLVLLAATGCGDTKGGAKPTAQEKNDFTLTAAPGTDMTGAIDKFKTLVGHCPGIVKYKDDIETVEYLSQGHADFLITVSQTPKVLPVESYGMGHTCHFSVDDTKATVSKRPCAWLCTGEEMSEIDGENHSYSRGKIISSNAKTHRPK